MEVIRRLLVFALLTGALASCSHKYKVDALNEPSTHLPSKSRVYIMLPADGQYGAKKYPGSGQMTANAVLQAFSVKGAYAEVADSREDRDTAFAKARQAQFDYVFSTTILNWEDRSTEWSGRPDRITLRFDVFEAKTGNEVASATNRASSRWLTFGGDHPQDLLPEITSKFVDSLF